MSVHFKRRGQSAVEVKPFDDRFEVSAWGYRHQQSLILFFALTIAYSMRACMGIALVAMTNHDMKINLDLNATDVFDQTTSNNKEIDVNNTVENIIREVDAEEFEIHGFFNALMLTPPFPSFRWNKKIQDTVISSFFMGYMTLQIPAGQLAHRFGARYLITGALFINCIVSAVIPIGAYYGGWICISILRVLQGLSQACIVPGIHTFFGKWSPLEERGRLTAMTFGGQALGTVLGLPVTGFIASSSLGWPGLFRFYAILSGTIGAVVWWLAADTPASHPNISSTERKYIEDGLGQKAGYEKRRLPVPWCKIFKSKEVYAIISAHVGNAWGQVVLFSEVPAFMDKVMGVNIKANGLLTALPFMVMWLTNFFFSWFTDMLIVKKVMSVTNVRKLANSIGCVPAALGFVILAYAPKNIYVVESILIIICAFKISAHLGFQVNIIDLSPNFAGTLMSLSNFVANGVVCLAPIITGIILTDVESVYLWRQVFFVAAGLYFFTNLVYVIFGSSEKAEWNEPDDEKNNDENKQEMETMLNNEIGKA